MTVPKRGMSKVRAAKRRTHYRVSLPKLIEDKDGSHKMPHHTDPLTKEY